MTHRSLLPFAVSGALLLLGGCATPSSESSEATPPSASERRAESENRPEAVREPATATEKAVAERRTSSSSGSGTASDMAKLVEQLNEAARELATLRTANAKLRAERERATRTNPAAEPASVPAAATAVARADPVDERLAASLKSYAAFKQEMSALLSEVERARKSTADRSTDLKAATEQVRQAKAALARAEEDLRVEKRLRLEAETNAGQLRDQLRTIARAMSDAGLSADKLASSADSGSRSAARPPARYVVREGDTLMKIADRFYGDANKWRLIMEANRSRVGADGALEAGIELQIPRN